MCALAAAHTGRLLRQKKQQEQQEAIPHKNRHAHSASHKEIAQMRKAVNNMLLSYSWRVYRRLTFKEWAHKPAKMGPVDEMLMQ